MERIIGNTYAFANVGAFGTTPGSVLGNWTYRSKAPLLRSLAHGFAIDLDSYACFTDGLPATGKTKPMRWLAAHLS